MPNGKTLFRQKEKKETRKKEKTQNEKADNIWPDEENYVGLK